MLHYVASQAEKSNPELLSLPDELSVLEDASKTSLEQLRAEVTQLDNLNYTDNNISNLMSKDSYTKIWHFDPNRTFKSQIDSTQNHPI